jgi:hypothetical protein
MSGPSIDADLAYHIIGKARQTGPAILRHATTLPEADRPQFLIQAAQHILSYRERAADYARLPVDIQTFIESSEFLASGEAIYPSVMDVLREINSGHYNEAVLTGAIGTGKTTIALLTTAYQIHVLSCLHDPHAFFGLDPASEMVTIRFGRVVHACRGAGAHADPRQRRKAAAPAGHPTHGREKRRDGQAGGRQGSA